MFSMKGKGEIYWGQATRTYRGPLDVWGEKPCVIVKRRLSKGTAEAVFFQKDPKIKVDDAATIGEMLAYVRHVYGEYFLVNLLVSLVADEKSGEVGTTAVLVVADISSGEVVAEFEETDEYDSLCVALEEHEGFMAHMEGEE